MPRTPLAPQWAFLTLTFDGRHHHKTAETLFHSTILWLLTRIKRVSPQYFRLTPELTEKGILHYHILIHTHQFVRRAAFLNCWKARYGNHDIARVTDQLGLLIYMRKQNKDIAPVIRFPTKLCVLREFALPIALRWLNEHNANKQRHARLRASLRFFGPIDRFYIKTESPKAKDV